MYLFPGLFFGVCLITFVEWDACFIKQDKCKYKLTLLWQSQTKCYCPPVNYYACSHSHEKHLFVSMRLPRKGGISMKFDWGLLWKSANQLRILLTYSKNNVRFTCMPQYITANIFANAPHCHVKRTLPILYLVWQDLRTLVPWLQVCVL
jgi:hypothetical protein